MSMTRDEEEAFRVDSEAWDFTEESIVLRFRMELRANVQFTQSTAPVVTPA
jgi:nuclear transport factor 2 (NTF2) superfamily protein